MAARLFLFALACALAVASAAPTEKTVSVTEVTIPAERGAVKEVFIPVDAAKEGPVSLEIDLQPIVQNHGLFKYLPWNRLATPSAVDVNVNIEKEVKMEALEVRVNSALTTTTIHIDGSRLFGANNATEGTEDFVLSASTQPTALAIFLLTALPIVCIVGSVLCAVMLFQTTADKGEAYYPDEPAPAYSELVHIAKAVKIAEAERQSRLAQLEREREAALEEELPSYQESIERAHTAHASPISVVPPLVRDV